MSIMSVNITLGLRIGRVRLIFELPSQFGRLPHPLLYIEWYTAFTRTVDNTVQIYSVQRSTRAGQPNAIVVTADQVVSLAHLVGKCGREISKEWTSANVLDKAKSFWVNPYLTIDVFSADSLYLRSRGLL